MRIRVRVVWDAGREEEEGEGEGKGLHTQKVGIEEQIVVRK